MVAADHADLNVGARLDHLVQTDPERALREADGLRSDGRATGGVLAAQIWAATGRANFELGRMTRAIDAMRRAVAAATGTADADVIVSVSLSAAAVMAEAGDVDGALDMLGRLEVPEDAAQRGRLHTQFAYVQHHAGRLSEALEHADRAEVLLRSGNDQLGHLRLLINRGLIRLQQGRLGGAEQDFRVADDFATRLGQTAARAMIAANRGVVAGRGRDLRGALMHFAVAEELFTSCGNPGRAVAIMQIDRAEMLLHAGMISGAVEAATSAALHAASTGNLVVRADSQLLLARTQHAAGAHRLAIASAASAADLFGRAGRLQMVPHARSVVMQATLERGAGDLDVLAVLEEASAVVELLELSGWTQSADELRLVRVRAGFGTRHRDVVDADLQHLRLGAFSGQRDRALAGWYAEAMARASSDPAAALEACVCGLDLLDDIVAESATLEQRSAAMRLGNDLGRLTIELAIGLGDADTVLAAAEGTRARALHEELRERQRHRPLTVEGAQQLRGELSARLSDRTLVEWVVTDDTVWAVVFDASGGRLVRVGDRSAIVRARDHVLVWLDLAVIDPDASSVRAMRAARVLDDLLVAPLQLPPVSGVVLVPVDALHGVPWSGLPSFADRPMSLTPNAQVWLEADRRAGGPTGSVGLVVGPDVEGADVERKAVALHHRGASVAGGGGATAATVRSMLHGHDLVHIAAHGCFRSDHPLLSTLRLDDGDASLYDVVPDRVRSRLIVLSSCEGGAHGTSDGSEVLGLSAVLLARGAAAVLAPLTMVRDLECADFVADVHARLATGESFACAVAEVRRRWLRDDDLSRWAVASSFSCFGSGAVTMAPASQNRP